QCLSGYSWGHCPPANTCFLKLGHTEKNQKRRRRGTEVLFIPSVLSGSVAAFGKATTKYLSLGVRSYFCAPEMSPLTRTGMTASFLSVRFSPRAGSDYFRLESAGRAGTRRSPVRV